MSVLCISLFGGVKIQYDDQPREVKLTRTIQSLLAYLLLNQQRAHHRDVLASLFWGDFDQERARSCLNTALWRLRRSLEPDDVTNGTYLQTNSSGEVGFNWDSPHWLDVEVFEQEVGPIMTFPADSLSFNDAEKFEKGLMLYTADLLEGFYDDWALRERERLRLIYLQGQAHLMQYYRHRADYGKSITFGQQILGLDPLREDIHRDLMRLYLLNGQRALAIRQFERCSAVLKDELGIAPMEETQALHAHIANDQAVADLPESLPSDLSLASEEVLRQFLQAFQTLEQAQSQVLNAIQAVEKFFHKLSKL